MEKDKKNLINDVRKIYFKAKGRHQGNPEAHALCFPEVQDLTTAFNKVLDENNLLYTHLSNAASMLQMNHSKMNNILKYLLGKCGNNKCKTVNKETDSVCGVCKRILLFLREHNEKHVKDTSISS